MNDQLEKADFDFDLFVIGAGSGGVRASRMAAAHGARVAVAESGPLGGTCVNVGCVPKKLFVYASHVAEDVRDAASFGWTFGEGSFDWTVLRENKNREIERLNGIYRSLLEGAGVEIVEGRAHLEDAQTVVVGDRKFRAKTILVAVGGWPYRPDIPGIEHSVTSNEMFYLEELPRRAIVVGGGYIAVEFAAILHGFGVEVTQLYRGPKFLRGFDDDVRDALADEMRSKGIDLRFDANPESIERQDDDLVVGLSNGEELRTDLVLYATGRRANTADLGLEEAGVELRADGSIVVDELSRTTAPNIYALGDVTERVNLTPVAIHEAMCFVSTVYGDQERAPDHETIATAVFSQPPIGTVGLTEEEARGKGFEVDIYRSSFRPMKLSLSDNPERSLMKLVVDRSTQRILGAHMLGLDAAEIIQGVAIAVKMGATKAQFDATVGIHPTSAEEFVTMREPV